MIWAVGLRGAVAYGLALNLPQIEGESDEGIPAIESATLVIVVASTLILGGATGPLLRYFELQVRPPTPCCTPHTGRCRAHHAQVHMVSIMCGIFLHISALSMLLPAACVAGALQ